VHVAFAPPSRAEHVADLGTAGLRVDPPERTRSDQLAEPRELDSQAQILPGRQRTIAGDHCASALIAVPERGVPVPHGVRVGVNLEQPRHVCFPQRSKLEPRRPKG